MPNRSHAGIVGPFAPGGAGVRGGSCEGARDFRWMGWTGGENWGRRETEL